MEGFRDNFISWVLLFGIRKMFPVPKVWHDRLKTIILWLLSTANVHSIRECLVGITLASQSFIALSRNGYPKEMIMWKDMKITISTQVKVAVNEKLSLIKATNGGKQSVFLSFKSSLDY